MILVLIFSSLDYSICGTLAFQNLLNAQVTRFLDLHVDRHVIPAGGRGLGVTRWPGPPPHDVCGALPPAIAGRSL
jgi:hypothetical protein